MSWKIPKRVEVSNTERLVDSIFLFVSELVEHGAQVGHFIVMCNRLRCDILSTFLVAIGASNG